MVRSRFLTAAFAVAGALLLLFFALPLVAMAAAERPPNLAQALCAREVRSALWVSVSAAGVSTAIACLLGVPLAYVLARRAFPGRAIVQGLVDMPVVVPHIVAGIALLTLLGPKGPVGGAAASLGISFVDAFPGTVAAMLFVSAPFVVNGARSGFEAVGERLERVSRSLGASPSRTFLSISLPLAARPIISGAVMAWARAVSEFGAVLILAYHPRVGPTLIHERFTGFGITSARPVAILLIVICLAFFATLRLAAARRHASSGA